MKFFALIMSIYLLILSCFPCGDSKECSTSVEQKVSVTTQHREHNHNTEACTPFCTCSCCVASAFYQALPYCNVSKVVFQSVKYPICIISFRSEVSFSIWQPPQLG